MSHTRVPERLLWAIDGLPDRIDGPILEVGCGAGHALALLHARYPKATIVGIDRSPGQVAKARERNADAMRTGRLRVEALDLHEASAALGDATFALVLAVNVNAFWTGPESSLASLATLLVPRGVAHLAYEPPNRSALDKLRVALPSALEAGGFAVHETRIDGTGAAGRVCVVAARVAIRRRGQKPDAGSR